MDRACNWRLSFWDVGAITFHQAGTDVGAEDWRTDWYCTNQYANPARSHLPQAMKSNSIFPRTLTGSPLREAGVKRTRFITFIARRVNPSGSPLTTLIPESPPLAMKKALRTIGPLSQLIRAISVYSTLSLYSIAIGF